MGETFRKIGDWVKAHKALTIALGGGILVLIYLYYSSQQAAAANAAAAAQAASGMPDDTILSQEIQAQAALQQEQIQAQAQTAQEQYTAQVDTATLTAQQQASNAQTQAALTLGLAQAGDSTSSILQLLGAQPGTATTTSTVGNTTTNPTATATVTGATTGATTTTSTGASSGTGTNSQTNPAPVTAISPVNNTAVYANPNVPTLSATAQTFGTAPPSAYSVYVSNCEGANPDCVPGDQYCISSWQSVVNACDTQYVTDPSSPHNMVNSPLSVTPTADVSTSNDTPIYEADVTGGTAGGAGGTANNATFASIISSSGAPSSAATSGLMAQLENSTPSEWAGILNNAGVTNSASIQSQLITALGPNLPIAQTSSGVSGGDL